MNRKALALSAAAIAIAAAIAAYSYSGRDGRHEQDATSATTPTLADYRAAARDLQRAGAKETAITPKKVPVGEILSQDTRTVALSEDERAWLNRHHFISKEELEASKDIPDATLQEARTDARLQTIYGLRLLDRGETIAAATILTNAASHGSVYAYEEGAVALLNQQVQGNNGNMDPNFANQFRARMEVAKIMGDHRADALFAQHVPTYDSAANANAVQLQTTEFLRQLGLNAQAQGTLAAGPDPRPNADLWANVEKLQQAGGSADLVTVYGP